jgi:hypothetical protein
MAAVPRSISTRPLRWNGVLKCLICHRPEMMSSYRSDEPDLLYRLSVHILVVTVTDRTLRVFSISVFENCPPMASLTGNDVTNRYGNPIFLIFDIYIVERCNPSIERMQFCVRWSVHTLVIIVTVTDMIFQLGV